MLKTTARAPSDTGVQDVSTDDIFGDEEIPSSLIHQTQQIDPFIRDLFQQSLTVTEGTAGSTEL